MNDASQQIRDAINAFQFRVSPELLASQLLDILTAVNDRMDEIEKGQRRAANVASCLANGIQPD